MGRVPTVRLPASAGRFGVDHPSVRSLATGSEHRSTANPDPRRPPHDPHYFSDSFDFLGLAAQFRAISVTPLRHTQSMESSAAKLTGPLVAERAVMAMAAQTLHRLSLVDCAHLTKQEIADHTVEIVRASERLRVISSRFMAVSDRQTAAYTRGAHSMSGLINTSCGVSRRQGTVMNLIGTSPYRYLLFYQALLEGRIGPGHIEVLQPVWRKVDRTQFHAAEAKLVDLAELCTPEEFADHLETWRHHADEDAALDEYIANQAKQHFQYGFDLFGNVHYSGTVGPEHAEPFIETIETESNNHNTGHHRPSRTLGDSLVALVLDPDGKYRARLEILVPAAKPHNEPPPVAPPGAIPVHRDTGFCAVYWPRTARGTLIPPSIVNQIRGRGASVTEHVIDADGNIVGDRPAGRHFGAVQKRLIRLRDNHCRHPGCRRPARRCDYDHIQPYEHGGATLIRNGQALCRFHHRWKHRLEPGPRRPTIFDDTPLAIQLE